jgi:hypothetical protein
VILGIVGQVGEIQGQRLALPRWIERVHPKDPKEDRLWQKLLKKVKNRLAVNEILVLDAGVKISDLQAVQLGRYELRLAKNFTSRRNSLPEHGNKGRKPKYGALVRPLARKRKDKTLPATPPEEKITWQENGREIRAEIWRKLVLPHTVPDPKNSTFDVYAIYDPDFEDPWLLATPVKLKAESVRGVYRDRWPIEQIPLAAKQMVGAHRQSVHARESIQRLPELALLAGSLLSFLAATAPAVATGFWDRKPQRTPGRFRRHLMGQPFVKADTGFPGKHRKKNSATSHLPKGNLAPRQKITSAMPAVAV